MASSCTTRLYLRIRISRIQHTFLLEIPHYLNKERAALVKISPWFGTGHCFQSWFSSLNVCVAFEKFYCVGFIVVVVLV